MITVLDEPGLSFREAASYCHNLNRSLLSLHSARDQAVFEMLMEEFDPEHQVSYMRNGMHRNPEEFEFMWHDELPVDYINWMGFHENQGLEDCGKIQNANVQLVGVCAGSIYIYIYLYI